MLISPETADWASELCRVNDLNLKAIENAEIGPFNLGLLTPTEIRVEVLTPLVYDEMDGKERFLSQVYYLILSAQHESEFGKPFVLEDEPDWQMDYRTAWRMVDWFDRAHGPGKKEVEFLIEVVLLIPGFVVAAVDGYLTRTGEENARYVACGMLSGNETPTLEEARSAIAVARKLEGHEPAHTPPHTPPEA